VSTAQSHPNSTALSHLNNTRNFNPAVYPILGKKSLWLFHNLVSALTRPLLIVLLLLRARLLRPIELDRLTGIRHAVNTFEGDTFKGGLAILGDIIRK
jgi:hypothetical protein